LGEVGCLLNDCNFPYNNVRFVSQKSCNTSILEAWHRKGQTFFLANLVGACDPGTGSKNSTFGSKTYGSSSSVPPTPRTETEILESSNVRKFSFSELKGSTRNFRPDSLLGEGGFGSVFKGWMDERTLAPVKPGTGMIVAVKKLKLDSFQGHREWLVGDGAPPFLLHLF
jgi:hypothetical protein